MLPISWPFCVWMYCRCIGEDISPIGSCFWASDWEGAIWNLIGEGVYACGKEFHHEIQVLMDQIDLVTTYWPNPFGNIFVLHVCALALTSLFRVFNPNKHPLCILLPQIPISTCHGFLLGICLSNDSFNKIDILFGLFTFSYLDSNA